MNFNDIKPDLIYIELQSVIKDLIETINSSEIDSTDQDVATFSHDLLNDLYVSITRELDKLKRNSEWDSFTVAFYGETNAGKSTIIETLRILLDEPQKASSQKKFNVLASSLNIDSASFDEVDKQISQLNEERLVLEQKLKNIQQENAEQSSSLTAELNDLKGTIETKLSSLNLLQKLWHFFSKFPEEKLLKTKQEQFKQTTVSLENKVVEAEKCISENQQACKNIADKRDNMQLQLNKLLPYADGEIIGDGRSDYTLDSQSYLMQGEENTFTVLDVPGIEGKEEKVGENIWKAVNKAHAVFYVTAKAAAPQTGDEKHKGTLEKIKEHLGDQTEVWSIYNKRITNPMQLKKPELVSESEIASLAELDAKMHAQLGENYQGTMSVCGLVGYLAAAQCLVVGSTDYNRKAKFTKDFDEQQLLTYCGFSELKQFLVSDLIKDYKVKIIKANFNKANQVLKVSVDGITSLRDEKFQPLYDTLKLEVSSASDQLDIALTSVKSRLFSSISRSIDTFKSSVRKSVYSKIEGNIDNDDFKYELKKAIERAQSQFDENLPKSISRELSDFEEDINLVVERFRKHADELLDIYSSFESSNISNNFNPSVNIDHGVNVAGIISTVVGGVFLALSGAGVAAIVIGAFGLVFSLYKSVRSFFSSDYKKAQQKKSTDDNLNDIANQLEKSAKDNVEEAFKELEECVGQVKLSFKKPIEHTALINQILSSSIEKLLKTSNQLQRNL
ncbi:hypothetical protein [Colwellia sp. E2M01]|uniref:hypothetical protein n=1 Tax=Colwellia sp. E2M01 TaxID=2841561 RepID=UPI001C0A2C9B|nr:hypothetical protein [Colwellia sp. E2M01]MBU2869750.1 hypothetical protein [Colwellia sp. E2M01]